MLRGAFAFAILAVAILTSGRVQALPMVDDAEPGMAAVDTLTYERIRFENDAYVLALALYWEGGSTGEPAEGMRRIADVIIQRAALNRPDFGGGEIHNVVYHSHKTKTGGRVCQFSFACLPSTRRAPFAGARWDLSQQIAREALRDEDGSDYETAEYYLNTQFSSLRSICWFKSKLVAVGETGRHSFWRERKHSDAPAAAAKPEECVRYEAMASAQKVKAQKAKFAKGKAGKGKVAKAGKGKTKLHLAKAKLKKKTKIKVASARR